MKTLERQLQEYGEFQIGLRDPIPPDTVTSKLLRPDNGAWWHDRPILTTLAAAVVLILLVLIPLLLSSPQPDVADSAPTPEPTPPPADVTEPDGDADGDRSDPTQPVVVQPLVFTEIGLPDGDIPVAEFDGVSFNGAVHTITQSGQLWALADGENWEFVKDLNELNGPPISSIEAGEDALVLVARDQGVRRSGEACMAAGHQVYVHVMRVDGSWTSTRIPQPFTGESECRILKLGHLVVGAQGIMIIGHVDGPGSSLFEGHSVGWWSEGGVSWQPLDTTVADEHGGIQDALATEDGFVVLTDGDEDTPRVTLTTGDGQSWQTIESAALHDDGPLFEFRGEVLFLQGSVVKDLFSGAQRMPAEIFRGRRAWGPHVHFGGLGVVGTPSCSSLSLGCATPSTDGGEVETFVYSPDGVSFVEWMPTEFDYYTEATRSRTEQDEGTLGLVRVLGMTNEFVLVVHERDGNDETVQTLWVGRPPD